MLDRIKNKSIFRFLLVGGASTSIDFVIYMLARMIIGTTISKLLSMLCANIFSYFLNKRWTFRSKQNTSVRLVTLYVLSQIINIGVNVTANNIMIHLTNMVMPSFIVATGVAMVVNFLCQKIFVFSE